MTANQPDPLRPIGWWLLFCALCNCLGWGLSALHQLNVRGYIAAFGFVAAAALCFRRQLFPLGLPRVRLQKLRRRFRRPFPLAFLFLAVMAIAGGLLYPPGNPDGLTYRAPRVLHWLAEQRWHWIPQAQASFNAHACGFEWLTVPMFSLLKTDRWVFVYNGILYLLMPGLAFSLFYRLGVSPRVAWQWMWLVPAGLCFAMQAGSIGTDAFGALFAVAALDLALRARTSRRVSDVWLSILAAALLSGAKTSNLPLGLPWLVAVWPSLRLLWRRPLATAIVLLVALASSLAPVMFFIHQHGGGWLGQALESGGRPAPTPLVTVTANGLNLALDNLQPPVFPLSGWWNDHAYKLLPKPLFSRMVEGFEPGAAHLETMDLQFEVCAGLGLGVTALLLLSWLCAWRVEAGFQPASEAASPPAALPGQDARMHPPLAGWKPASTALVRWSAVIPMLAFMVAMNVSSPARLATPYYCLLMPLILVAAGHERLVRARWWQALGLATFLLTAMMLVLNPPRPLWPAQTILNRLSAHYPRSQLLTRAALLYQSYAVRWDLLAPVRDRLPPDAKDVGLMAFIDASPMETSLWRPFGQRRIWPLQPDQSRGELDAQHIHYAVIAVDNLHPQDKAWLDNWVQTHGGSVIAQVPIRSRATGEPWPWYIIKLLPPTN